MSGLPLIIMGVFLICISIRTHRVRMGRNYSYRQIANGRVLGFYNINGYRLVVKVVDRYGKELLCVDDRIYWGIFRPKHCDKIKKNSVERVYYWKNNSGVQYKLNGKPINYYTHFCNESFYSFINKRERVKVIIFGVFGSLSLIGGYILLIVGSMP